MRFDTVEARLTRAVNVHLSNAAGTLNGVQMQGEFSREFLEVSSGESGVASSSPLIRLPTSNVPASPVGLPLAITQGQGVGNWKIAQAEPDGAGETVLLLEKA